MFSSLLIANRGEIACRIIRTARAMGLRTIAVCSDADTGAAHVLAADRVMQIGPAAVAESYLNSTAIIEAAKEAGADAIHPGYGFLAENADFAEAVLEAGLIFVGPPAAAIAAMGAKHSAKQLMETAGVPVVPGYHGNDQKPERLAAEADRIGFPVLIKPAFGGGGKGMRRVAGPQDFASELQSARREAKAAFGDDRMIIERFITSPRHIEVQIFADSHGNFVHLFERDCTLQRRHQKVIEEAPAPGMTAGLRAAMTDAAIAAAKAVGYVGAGTVEFILKGSAPLADDTPFYFMEMNTRLQVEHPVTEAITGFDLVEWQLVVAAGQGLPVRQDDITISGHAVEARIYAENPVTGFLPATGKVLHFKPPSGPGLRTDTGVGQADEITSHYDPMIAKVIAHGDDREEAIARLDEGLAEFEFAGPQTNQSFLRLLLADGNFIAATMDTGLIDRKLPEFIARLQTARDGHIARGVRAVIARVAAQGRHDVSPWATSDAFQLGPSRAEKRSFVIEETARDFDLVWVDGAPAIPGLNGANTQMTIVADGAGVVVVSGGDQLRVRMADPFEQVFASEQGNGELRAPMPGLVIGVDVQEGQKVDRGQLLLVLEAMKMEHTIKSPFDGVVRLLAFAPGDRVAQGDKLAVVEPHLPETAGDRHGEDPS